jgi:hypothetical protein
MAAKFQRGIDVLGQRILNVGDPSSGSDAVNKTYVDNVAVGLDWKENVRAATNANIDISNSLVDGASIGGVTVATGDRVLLFGQSTASENGPYTVVASGAASRTPDADSSSDIKNMIVRVSEGTNADKMYQLITDNVNLGTTSLTFTEFGGGGTTYTADGNGIQLSSNEFQLELDGTSLSKSASGLRIGSGAAGNGLTESTGVLAVGAGTGISVAADAVAIDTSVVARKFAADCVVTTDPQNFDHGLGTDVSVDVWEGNTKVYPDIEKSSTSGGRVTITWGTAPTAGQYRVVVRG